MPAVRLPLYVGADALWYAAVASALVPPGLIACAVGGYQLAHGKDGLYYVVAGVPISLFGLACVAAAWWARVSDVVLDERGVGVEGGGHGGLFVPWPDLLGATLTEASEARLTLHTRTGLHVVAEVASQSERASLRALERTLAAKVGELEDPAPEPSAVLTCGGCGAPLAVDERATVRCGGCGKDNPLPEAIRARVAETVTAQRAMGETVEAVTRLLDQPGAIWSSAMQLVASLTVTAGWVGITSSLMSVGAQAVDAPALAIGLASGWALTFGCFSLARLALARRRALIVLRTTFGARPPKRAGEGSACRRCGGALPAASALVSRCAYCGSDNLIGSGVTPLVQHVREHTGSVADLLRDMRRERGRWVKIGSGALVAVLLGGFGVVVQVAATRELAEKVASCDQGRAEACFLVGLAYSTGGSVRQDKAEALRHYARACERDHAEACHKEAFAYELGVGAPRDIAKAKACYERACRLGWKAACDARKELDVR